MLLKLVGNFEGVKLFESFIIQNGHAITLPPYGIFLSPETYSSKKDSFLIKHEFGHILQYRKLGFFQFYFLVGLPSLYSAIKASTHKKYKHQTAQVEVEANSLSYQYFKQPSSWPLSRFPIKKI
jgi:hypothetical protein